MPDYQTLTSGNPLGQRKRGRPPGSKNKPKTVISVAALKELTEKIGPYVPKDDMEYLSGILEGTVKPDLERDIDVLLALQLKALLPQLAEEIRSGQLSREATQRSSTIKELLALRVQREKRATPDEQPNTVAFIQNVFNARDFDASHLANLLGVGPEGAGMGTGELPRLVAGDVYRDEGLADEAGAVPDEVPERPE